ncbi:MAG: hypothetical protein NZ932_06050 [Candidatus Bathyarchaeota archaeon]|nr:hypothetical protein [Candidatus Bathyarchaeota archaeon]MDW8040896.1 hypothetical protein [Nitrososphaerota archaeon]
MNELESKRNRRRVGLKVARAFLITAASAIFWLILWFLTSTFLAGFPNYLTLFTVLAGGFLFFTFTIALAEGTIYKYILMITRAFFLIVYLTHATNGGILTINLENLAFTVEFVPLLALMVFINLLDVARRLLQAIEFASQSPKD